MPRISFTANLQRLVAMPPMDVEGAAARGYVLDDQGAVRKHVTIFVNAVQIANRTRQSDPVPAGGDKRAPVPAMQMNGQGRGGGGVVAAA